MLALTTDQRAALGKPHVMRRIFVYCWPRNPTTGELDPGGFWDDDGVVEVDGRVYHGSSLFSISTLSAKSNMTIPGLTVTLAKASPAAMAMVHAATFGQAPIEVAFGIFDTGTRQLIGSLIRRFVGVVDDIDIIRPKQGDRGTIILTCESASRALTIQGTDTRSSAFARRFRATDAFYDYTNTVADQALYFGRATP